MMFPRFRVGRPVVIGLFFVGALSASVRAGYLDDLGYTALVAELLAEGKPLPDGSGVTAVQTEASTGTSAPGGVTTYAYLANGASFSGVTITNASAAAYPAAISGHANTVAGYFFGDTSMASGITSVTAYLADDWVESGFLNAGLSSAAPKVQSSDVLNASWVGTYGNSADDRIVLDRIDYSIERDDYVVVVATNNGSTPQNLAAGAYNVISVGLTNGNHAAGSSALNGAVTFPLLVAPMSATSWATPVVSSAAALLIETARDSPATSANGAKSETIKAILLAGATKSEFASWTRTDAAPLDPTYGAGELNIQNSYHIMTAGEQVADSAVAATGWDFHSISLHAAVSYSFDLATSGDVSIVLTWNAIFSGSDFDAMTLSLANLDLYLYSVGSGGGLSLVQESLSSGNVEAIWFAGLGAGNYLIQVTYDSNAGGSLTSAEYALAWQTISPVPESTWCAGVIVSGLVFVVWGRSRRLARLRASDG